MQKLAEEIGNILKKKGLTLGVIESATGGYVSHIITSVPGCSEYYKGSITAYANQTKINVVGVKKDTLDKYGAVSYQVAQEMASGGANILKADVCVSDTGIAGPGGATMNKPVGLFYLGLSYHNQTYSYKYIFNGDREQNIKKATRTILMLLKKYLTDLV